MDLNILIVVAGLVLVIIGGLIGVIILTTQPTHGNKIVQYEFPQQALLVIDIQEDNTGTTAQPPFPYKESKKLIATVNTIIEAASQNNILIVYIRQEFDGVWGRMLSKVFARGTAMRGNPGTEIDKRIAIRSSHILSKPKGDAFSIPKLDALLIEHQVNEVYLVGLDAEFCVHHTAKGALNRGYTINIITDGIALRAKKKWEKLLEQYQKEGIRLMLSQEFIAGSPRASAREDYH
jgi:nicotinamidase-related amidase